MGVDLLLLAFACVCLYAGAHWLIGGALQLGKRFGFTATVTGLVVIALGTSVPELAVALDAALRGHGVIAAGSVVGSNIVNVMLVLGAAALFGRMRAERALRRRDLPLLMLLTGLAAYALSDGQLGRPEGLVLLVYAIVVVVHGIRGQRGLAGPEPATGRRRASQAGLAKPIGLVSLGVVALVVGADAMVTSGIDLARHWGVSEAVIALTVTAIGTGIPEIAATLVAVARRQHALALGNIVGSNLMNLGLVLGVTGLVAPLGDAALGALPLVTMVGATLALWLLLAVLPTVHRGAGLLLLSAYGAYQIALVN